MKPGAVFYGDGGNGGIGLIVQYNAFDAVIAEVNVYMKQTYPSAVGTLFRVARRNKKFLQLCCHLCRSGMRKYVIFA